jgi:DNA-binding transcriptional LysR family regulator
MKWDDVRVLLTLLDMRNLHEASKRLGIDRSTAARRLSNLERRLGTTLFARTRDGLEPTPAADRVRPYAEKMAADAAALAQAARSDESEVTGVVRVATTEAMAAVLVEHGLLSLHDQHPNLVIEILGGNKPVDLLRGDVDLALRVSALRHASLRVRCVARLKVGLFAAPSYIERHGRPTTPSRLRGHAIVLPTGDLAQLPEARWLEARPGVRIAFRSNSLPTLTSAAARGLGVVPLTVAWGAMDRRLELVQTIDAIPTRAFWLVTPRVGGHRAGVRVVADAIAAIFARL